jgi:hypothetical protein
MVPKIAKIIIKIITKDNCPECEQLKSTIADLLETSLPFKQCVSKIVTVNDPDAATVFPTWQLIASNNTVLRELRGSYSRTTVFWKVIGAAVKARERANLQ